MRFAYPLLMVLLAAVVFGLWAGPLIFADPSKEATSFLQDIQSGSLARTVKNFGGNTCHCPKKGGWGSYLIYASSQEPNLAFMLGHPFSLSKVIIHPLENKEPYFVPWQKPEDAIADVVISFDPKQYAPYFLPLEMAYGQEMTKAQFDDFLKDPDNDAWKAFTLRLRPSIAAGAVVPPREKLPESIQAEFQALNDAKTENTENSEAEETIKAFAPEESPVYAKPQEAGPVQLEGGKRMSQQEVQSALPRLQSTILRLHIVRRGQLADWTIYHFGLMKPVLLLKDNRLLHLVHDRPPS